MKKALTSVLFAIACTGNAYADKGEATVAAVQDAATTALALGMDYTELNPLGAVGGLAAKVGAMAIISRMPETQQAASYNAVASVWGGAATSNLCMLTGLGPICYAVGLARGAYVWSKGEDERAFWAYCDEGRKSNPSLKCEWNAS